MHSQARSVFSILALLAAGASSTHASMLGDTVEIWGRAQLNGTQYLRDTVVVSDPGVEFSTSIGENELYRLDLTSHSITMDVTGGFFSPWFNSGHEPTALEIRDINVPDDPEQIIGAVAVSFGGVIEPEDNAPLNYAAFSDANVEFGDDWVRIITGPYHFQSGSFVRVDLTFVPSPGPAALGALGLIAGARRRR